MFDVTDKHTPSFRRIIRQTEDDMADRGGGET